MLAFSVLSAFVRRLSGQVPESYSWKGLRVSAAEGEGSC